MGEMSAKNNAVIPKSDEKPQTEEQVKNLLRHILITSQDALMRWYDDNHTT